MSQRFLRKPAALTASCFLVLALSGCATADEIQSEAEADLAEETVTAEGQVDQGVVVDVFRRRSRDLLQEGQAYRAVLAETRSGGYSVQEATKIAKDQHERLNVMLFELQELVSFVDCPELQKATNQLALSHREKIKGLIVLSEGSIGDDEGMVRKGEDICAEASLEIEAHEATIKQLKQELDL